MFHVETAAERAAWLEANQVGDYNDRGDHGGRGDHSNHGDFFIALTGSSSGQGVKRRLEERPADGMLGEELQEQVWSSLALSSLV